MVLAMKTIIIKKKKTGHLFQPGHAPVGKRKVGNGYPSLLTRIKKILKQRSTRFPNGVRADDVAEAYIRAMEQGSFVHLKEFIDREEGKVPTRIADADGGKMKAYVGMPLEGDQAP